MGSRHRGRSLPGGGNDLAIRTDVPFGAPRRDAGSGSMCESRCPGEGSMALAVGRLPPQAAEDAGLLGRLVGLINDAYAIAEEGLWLTGVERTDLDQTYAAVAAGRVLVGRVDRVLAGTVQTQEVGGSRVSFGTLAVDAVFSGRGVGSALVRRVEMDAAVVGARFTRLEVLVAEPIHPHLERLAAWYSRLGYREVGRTALDQISPREVPFLRRACEVSLMEKVLPE
jgi:GNAT superfamily N-acetyltransferase